MVRITLKDLISFNNSEKYRSNKTRDANKETIESFLQQEKKKSYYKDIKYDFGRMDNIFTLKKNCDYYIEYN